MTMSTGLPASLARRARLFCIRVHSGEKRDNGVPFYTHPLGVAERVVEVSQIVEKLKPITYPIAAVAGTQKQEPAQRFIEYILKGEGQAILSKYGFGKP